MAAVGLTLAPALAAQTGATGVGSQFELVFWQSVATSEDIGQYEAYLSRYPEGTFAALARAKIERLRPAPPRTPTSQPTVAQPPAPSSAVKPTGGQAPLAAGAPVAVATPRVDIPVTPAVPAPSPDPAISQAPASAASATPLAAAPPPAAPATAALDAALAPAPAANASPSPPSQLSLAQQLAALAQSQGRAPAGAAGGRTIPAPPVLRAPDPVVLPPHFCSAVERNAFYDEHFTPSKDVADDNNRLAIAHLQALQRLYDELGQRGDPDGQNAVAAESKGYQPVAAGAYQASAAYEQLFQSMMAVPIADCAAVPPKAGKP